MEKHMSRLKIYYKLSISLFEIFFKFFAIFLLPNFSRKIHLNYFSFQTHPLIPLIFFTSKEKKRKEKYTKKVWNFLQEIKKNIQIKSLLTLGLGLPEIFAVKTASDPSTSFEFLGFCVICGGATGPRLRSTTVEICTSDSPTKRRVIDSRNSVSRNNLYSNVSTCKLIMLLILVPRNKISEKKYCDMRHL